MAPQTETKTQPAEIHISAFNKQPPFFKAFVHLGAPHPRDAEAAMFVLSELGAGATPPPVLIPLCKHVPPPLCRFKYIDRKGSWLFEGIITELAMGHKWGRYFGFTIKVTSRIVGTMAIPGFFQDP